MQIYVAVPSFSGRSFAANKEGRQKKTVKSNVAGGLSPQEYFRKIRQERICAQNVYDGSVCICWIRFLRAGPDNMAEQKRTTVAGGAGEKNSSGNNDEQF